MKRRGFTYQAGLILVIFLYICIGSFEGRGGPTYKKKKVSHFYKNGLSISVYTKNMYK
jgi:hypothetical protein